MIDNMLLRDLKKGSWRNPEAQGHVNKNRSTLAVIGRVSVSGAQEGFEENLGGNGILAGLLLSAGEAALRETAFSRMRGEPFVVQVDGPLPFSFDRICQLLGEPRLRAGRSVHVQRQADDEGVGSVGVGHLKDCTCLLDVIADRLENSHGRDDSRVGVAERQADAFGPRVHAEIPHGVLPAINHSTKAARHLAGPKGLPYDSTSMSECPHAPLRVWFLSRHVGGVPKWTKGTDCKSVIHGFESHRRL